MKLAPGLATDDCLGAFVWVGDSAQRNLGAQDRSGLLWAPGVIRSAQREDDLRSLPTVVDSSGILAPAIGLPQGKVSGDGTNSPALGWLRREWVDDDLSARGAFGEGPDSFVD